MTTILLAAITVLLALILVVLLYHLPEEKRSAFVGACLKVGAGIPAAALLAAGLVLGTGIGITNSMWHAKFSSAVWLIPLLMLTVSAALCAIAIRAKWRTILGWIFVALMILLAIYEERARISFFLDDVIFSGFMGIAVLGALSLVAYAVYHWYQTSSSDDKRLGLACLLLVGAPLLPVLLWPATWPPVGLAIVIAICLVGAVMLTWRLSHWEEWQRKRRHLERQLRPPLAFRCGRAFGKLIRKLS